MRFVNAGACCGWGRMIRVLESISAHTTETDWTYERNRVVDNYWGYDSSYVMRARLADGGTWHALDVQHTCVSDRCVSACAIIHIRSSAHLRCIRCSASVRETERIPSTASSSSRALLYKARAVLQASLRGGPGNLHFFLRKHMTPVRAAEPPKLFRV